MKHVEIIPAPHQHVDLEAGQHEDAAWDEAQPVHITRYWSGDEAPVARHAEARIVWSNESLNVRFVCNQTQPLIVSSNPQLNEKTIGLWDRDVCEIFIAPIPDQPYRYFEFEAAPTGEWVDLAVRFHETKRESDFEFSSGMTVATLLSGEQLRIGIRIPWSAFLPKPQRGDEWRVNLFRCVGLGNKRYLAWRPTFTTEPNFHVPEAFGRLRFI